MRLRLWTTDGVPMADGLLLRQWAKSAVSSERITPADLQRIENCLSTPAATMTLFSLLAQHKILGVTLPTRTPGQKPQYSGLHWNTSHHGNTLVIADGPEEVGVDVMELTVPARHLHKVERLWKAVANQFTDREMHWLEQVKDNELEARKRFYFLWTAKEAFVKYSGRGILENLHKFEVRPLPEAFIEAKVSRPTFIVAAGKIAPVKLLHLVLKKCVICVCVTIVSKLETFAVERADAKELLNFSSE